VDPVPGCGGLLSAAAVLARGAADGVFPGGVLAAVDLEAGDVRLSAAAGVLSHDPPAGRVGPPTIYDLASLTKLFTAAAICLLEDEGAFALEDPVASWVPTLPGVTVRHLLEHRSGLPAWQPLYEAAWPGRGGPSVVEQALAVEPAAAPGDRHEYSDIGFLVLGEVVRRATGRPLDAWVQERVLAGTGLSFRGTGAGPEAAAALLATGTLAPSEICPDRGLVCGEVMDRNAWTLGGRAPHAGVFGTAADVAGFAVAFAGGRFGAKRRDELFAAPAGGHVLGWDTVAKVGSSAGSLLSPASRGHLGFSGTSLWIDPDRGAAVVLLTNRTHPDRQHTAIRAFRPRLHDAVARDLDRLSQSAPPVSLKGNARD